MKMGAVTVTITALLSVSQVNYRDSAVYILCDMRTGLKQILPFNHAVAH